VSVSAARAAAFEILMRMEATDSYASELLHSSRLTKLSAADHALLTELVMGVLRWRSVLDDEIGKRSNQPLTKLDREVLGSLRLGAYQLLFLDRIPARAAINESVELVKRARKKSAAGMVNAVLRKLAEAESSGLFKKGIAGFDWSLSHPRWLVERWEGSYGAEITSKICESGQSVPSTTIRNARNAVGGSQDDPQLAEEGLKLEPGRLLTTAAVITAGDIHRTAAFRDHRLVIQDEASQLVALLVGHGESILDCCAAPGGKTRILAQRNPNATIVAMDLHPHRAKLTRRLVSQSTNVHVIAADARSMPLARKFDRILVDAPCSGTGTLARNPEIKWRLRPEDILRLQKYQVEILTAVMKHAAVGGRIVYSTCSLEPEENDQVVIEAIAADSTFRVFDCRNELMRVSDSGELVWKDVDSLLSGPYLRTIPGVHPCDGFFAAVLEKVSV